METAVPVSYSFPSHDMASVAHRRMMAPHHDHQGMAYYHNPYAAPIPQQSSYGFGHILNNQHHTTYQPFFQHNPPLTSSAPRIPSDPVPAPAQQHLNEVHHRPVKHELSRLITETTPPAHHRPVEDEVRQSIIQEKTPPATSVEKSPGPAGTLVEFSTEVDTLMKAIQAKVEPPEEQQQQQQQQLPSIQKQFSNRPTAWMNPAYSANSPVLYIPSSVPPQEERVVTQKQRRKYECTLSGCTKSFFQKTHLDIHTRSHTGDKPFTCKEPGCGQKFSQLGNLRTHERRHTGEKPFACEICHKRFAQRGNVRAHKITHQESKPYICRLDDCGKQFTQLGNLKSHQNKFHASSLRHLTLRFANITDAERLTGQDLELWEYFASLYKNSNKGIKGRGKDRRVSTVSKSATPPSSHISKQTKSGDANSHFNSQSSSFSEQTGHLTPPVSDDNGAVGRGYERMAPDTAPSTAATTPYLGTPTSEEVSFHDQPYPPYSHHPHHLPQLQHHQQQHHPHPYHHHQQHHPVHRI